MGLRDKARESQDTATRRCTLVHAGARLFRGVEGHAHPTDHPAQNPPNPSPSTRLTDPSTLRSCVARPARHETGLRVTAVATPCSESPSVDTFLHSRTLRLH